MLTHKGTVKLETERLILRQARLSDAEAMFRNWANDPEVTKFLTWPTHSSPEISRMVIGSWLSGYDKNDHYHWMITVKADGDEPIGSISAVSMNEAAESVEIGYCIGRNWWHRGIMTEALGTVIRYMISECGFQRITAKHDCNNPHSGGVMRKCGMRYEGTFRRSARNNQGICDMDHYAILKEDLDKPKHFMEGFEPSDDEALVQEIYRRSGEETRLTRSQAARVEFLTTVRCIERYLRPGDRILDIGAGAGEYSLYFSRKGYEVSAVELSDANIAAFRSRLTPEDKISLTQRNALDLSIYGDASFDTVLLLGPLYHLHSKEDRLKCLEEAKRVCKPDGKLYLAFISNDPVILTMQQAHHDYLLKGDYDKETFRLEDFPFVFDTVPHARALLEEAELHIHHEVASDGLSELLAGMIDRMDEESYQQYLRYHSYICEKPECIGLSNHLLYVCSK